MRVGRSATVLPGPEQRMFVLCATKTTFTFLFPTTPEEDLDDEEPHADP